MVWFGIFLTVAMFVVFIQAVEKTKYGEFGDSSFWLSSLGIYVWGQGLILAPFWILFSVACMFWWTPTQALSAYVWFHIIRAGAELIMLRQKNYTGLLPVLEHGLDKMSSEHQLQLYQLGQALVITGGIILLYTA